MTNENNATPAPARRPDELQAIRALIRKRKRADRIFNFAGAALIIFSMGVLAILVAGLFRDGAGRLFQTHEVKPDGTAPGFREIVGTVRRLPAGGKLPAGWGLDPDPINLHVSSSTIDLKALVGRRVSVRGDVPRAGEKVMSVDAITAIPDTAPGEEIPGTPDVVGIVTQSKGKTAGGDHVMVLDPEAMRIELAESKKADVDFAKLDGKKVAVDAGRRGRKPAQGLLQANDVIPMQTKSFFSSMPSMSASRAGVLPAVVGTMLVMLVTMLVAVPLGVAAGVYLEEYAPKNKLTALIEINIANLAGIPSIIWGLAGLGLFIFAFGFERSIMTAGLTLGLLVLPIVIISTREAIRTIPGTIREASIGLGSTKWQTVRHHVLPYSVSGILTGSIIAMSRAIGETAPLVCIGAVLFITYLPPAPIGHSVDPAAAAAHAEAIKTDPGAPAPAATLDIRPVDWLDSKFTVVPMQIFDWVSRPQTEFHQNAAAAGIVLVVLTLGLNGIAIALRYRTRKGLKW